MSGKKSVHEVFTPTTPARLAFVERDAINNKLVNALRTPGKQVVVYGHSGSGKTTLLVNKLHQLYEKHITSRCMIGVSFEQLVLDAFDQLAPFYVSELGSTKKTAISATLSQDYISIKTQISSSIGSDQSKKKLRMLPPQLTPQALARFMGEARCCWVLEDFHKIEKSERKKLSQIMKVFMDMADEYKELKVIAIGAVDTARQVVEYDAEMRNRVAEIFVPLMDAKEIKEIISKGENHLRLRFVNELKDGIGDYSNGLASVCHHLCLNICTSQDVYETVDKELIISKDALAAALSTYLDEASDTLKKAFEKAFKQERIKKYDNARLILKALSELPQEGGLRSEIFQKITNDEPNYPQGNLTSFLSKLCNAETDAIVRLDAVSGRYSFIDPLYRSFAIAMFSKSAPKLSGDKISIEFDRVFSDVSISLADILRSEMWADVKVGNRKKGK